MKTKAIRADFFWPLAGLGLLAMALLVGVTLTLVRQFDISAEQHEQTVVENGLAGRAAEIARIVVPLAVWDDAVRHLDLAFDPDWARQNIGAELHQIDGIDSSIILDRSDRPVFATDKGAPVAPSHFAGMIGGARNLVAAVRGAEVRRPPLRGSGRDGKSLAQPIQASAVTPIDGDLYILTATLVQPDFGTVAPSGPRAPIVLTGMLMDQGFMDAFGRRFLLRNIHLHASDSRSEPNEAHAALRDDEGRVVGTIDWTPDRPGAELLSRLVMPILVVVAFLTITALLLYRRSRRMAQSMIASEARASHLAYYDALTGLPNRVLFFDRLGQALQQMRRSNRGVAIHCIDLDRFKEVNDTFGHHVGDELIQVAAKRLAAQCRGADTVARLSGDEFAIVQTDATAQAAAHLAARLVEVMAEPVMLGSVRVFAGCSVGVSLLADASIDPAEALRQADLALYRAKQTAKGQFCFFEIEMDAAIKTRRVMECDLRDALANGDLEMAYQPQVNGRGVMTGVEALVRWRHPVRGDISPAFFVPIAEECGLIVELGMFTLRRAFEDSRRWRHLKVAINVSANQLRLKDFVAKLADLVLELNINPRQFELEITEGVLLGDDPDTQNTLRRLRNLGFGIALDDFGTGYSSLSYLRRYPISKIKIDRSFITNLGQDNDAEAVVAAIVRLAHALNLSVIAEGVETADQLRRLAAAGCSDVQGYLFSKAVAAGEIDRMQETRSLALERQTAA